MGEDSYTVLTEALEMDLGSRLMEEEEGDEEELEKMKRKEKTGVRF